MIEPLVLAAPESAPAVHIGDGPSGSSALAEVDRVPRPNHDEIPSNAPAGGFGTVSAGTGGAKSTGAEATVSLGSDTDDVSLVEPPEPVVVPDVPTEESEALSVVSSAPEVSVTGSGGTPVGEDPGLLGASDEGPPGADGSPDSSSSLTSPVESDTDVVDGDSEDDGESPDRFDVLAEPLSVRGDEPSEEDELDESEPLAPAEPVLSANATAGIDEIAAPIPSATASAPNRPTYRPQPAPPPSKLGDVASTPAHSKGPQHAESAEP